MSKKKPDDKTKSQKYDAAKMAEQSAKNPDDFETEAAHPQTQNKKS